VSFLDVVDDMGVEAVVDVVDVDDDVRCFGFRDDDRARSRLFDRSLPEDDRVPPSRLFDRSLLLVLLLLLVVVVVVLLSAPSLSGSSSTFQSSSVLPDDVVDVNELCLVISPFRPPRRLFIFITGTGAVVVVLPLLLV
jgi:hypothetical protein